MLHRSRLAPLLLPVAALAGLLLPACRGTVTTNSTGDPPRSDEAGPLRDGVRDVTPPGDPPVQDPPDDPPPVGEEPPKVDIDLSSTDELFLNPERGYYVGLDLRGTGGAAR